MCVEQGLAFVVMGALRILSRIAAAVCQLSLLPQRVPGLATYSPLRPLQRSTTSCSLFQATSTSGLSSRGTLSSVSTNFEGSCRSWQIGYGKRQTGAGLPYGVSLKRSQHTAAGSMRSEAPAPLPVAEVKAWQALNSRQRMTYLRGLPVEQRWPFLQRLEVSGLRPEIRLWSAALQDMGSSNKLEALVAHVEELWEKGYNPDAVTYYPLLQACRRESHVLEALNIYRQMIGRSVQPTQGTFAVLANVLKECYCHGGGTFSENLITPRSEGLPHVRAILEGMAEFGVPMDNATATSLVTVLSKACNVANDAQGIKLARDIQVAVRNQGIVADDALCAMVLNCHTVYKKGNMSGALAAFEEMESLGEKVGYRTHATLIKAYSLRGDFAQAMHHLHRASSQGIKFEGRSLGFIFTALGVAGRYNEAERLFKEVERSNLLNSFIIAAYMKTCSVQKKLNDIYLLSKKFHTLFTLDSSRGVPHRLHLLPVLLHNLATTPTKEGVDVFRRASEFCESSLASTCAGLLCNPCKKSWDAFFEEFVEYQVTDPVAAVELVQNLGDCFWALGRREDSVHLLVWVKERTRLLQAVIRYQCDRMVVLDLHSLSIGVGLAMVLLALREIVVKSKEQSRMHACEGLVIITGKGSNRQEVGGLRTEVQDLLLEYGFLSTKLLVLQGSGRIQINGSTIGHWLKSLNK